MIASVRLLLGLGALFLGLELCSTAAIISP